MTSNKWVFVTGGNRGIGAEIVRMLSREGYKLIFTYHSGKDSALALVEEVNNQGGDCSCYHCDVTDHHRVSNVCSELYEKNGAPYGIINNAGITKDKLLVNTGPDDWNRVINTNLNAVYSVIHALLPAMLPDGEGAIINIGSVSALRGNIGQVAYSASKAALSGLTRSLAKEAGMFNIRVNCIAPGLIETDMISSLPEAKIKFLIRQTALGKTGKPDDIANMVSYLLSDAGKNITGQTIVIDGGLSI